MKKLDTTLVIKSNRPSYSFSDTCCFTVGGYWDGFKVIYQACNKEGETYPVGSKHACLCEEHIGYIRELQADLIEDAKRLEKDRKGEYDDYLF
jgi:hypothetical protein